MVYLTRRDGTFCEDLAIVTWKEYVDPTFRSVRMIPEKYM